MVSLWHEVLLSSPLLVESVMDFSSTIVLAAFKIKEESLKYHYKSGIFPNHSKQ